MKNAVVKTAVGVTRGVETVATTPSEEAEPGFMTAFEVSRCIETVAETPGKSGNNIGQEDKCLQTKLYRIPLARKRKKYSQKKPVEKLSKP